MTVYNFVPEEAFEGLPRDTAAAFLQLMQFAERGFAKEIEGPDGESGSARDAFAQHVIAIADELGIQDLPTYRGSINSAFQDFETSISALKARLRLRLQRQGDPSTVNISSSTRNEIESRIASLREYIMQSSLSERKKAALSVKLDELEQELRRRRISLAAILKIAASVAAILGGASAALANAPEAAHTILQIVEALGIEKAHEDDVQLRLPPVPKALPAPRTE